MRLWATEPFNIETNIVDSTARAVQNKLPGYNKAIAASRSLGAKQINVPIINYYSPPLSAIGIVLGLIVFFTGIYCPIRPRAGSFVLICL